MTAGSIEEPKSENKESGGKKIDLFLPTLVISLFLPIIASGILLYTLGYKSYSDN